MIHKLSNFILNYFKWISIPEINVINIIEVFLLTFFIYKIISWLKNTKAWILLKGIFLLLGFYMVSFFIGFHAFVWIFEKTIGFIFIGIMVVFQPELRKGLEELGTKNLLNLRNILIPKKDITEKFTDKNINEIFEALKVLSVNKTGALILLEQNHSLLEYEQTGIDLNSNISKELLINIFEHNTPLHDGAVILKNNKISAATCYLPLSKNLDISKALGTRHRAALGISEVSDCLVLVVSEETGAISITKDGKLFHNIKDDLLMKKLSEAQHKEDITERRSIFEKVKKYIYK